MLTFRPAQPDDLPVVARVFFMAFADSVEHAGVGSGGVEAIQDLFAVSLAAERGSLIVADSDGEIVGYILATTDVARLRRAAFWQGYCLRLLWRTLSGSYDLRWRTLRILAADKWAFLRGARRWGAQGTRLLSLAVHPGHQSQGIGRQLIQAALEYLRNKRAQPIRLEVRPDNAAALHLYQAAGFRARGEYCDSQGKWLVMVRENWQDA